jgi:hypothetical protein
MDVRNNVLKRTALAALMMTAIALALPSGAQDMGTAPAWAQAMTAGTWTTLNSQNKISDLDPANDPAANPNYPGTPQWAGNNGQDCVINCWNGGALATGLGTKGSLIIWGGGHAGYYGNEVYAFDLATLRWSRLSNPYPTPSFPVAQGIWPDGTPSVPHTEAMVGYHPPTNSFATMLTQTSNQFLHATVPNFFDLGAKKWRHAPEAPSPVQYGGWAAYDASRDAWYMEGGDSGGGFARYVMGGDGTAGTWTTYTAKLNALGSMAYIDPVDDILVITTFEQNDTMYGLDLKDPGGALVTLNQGGSPPANREGRHGWEWSTTHGGFIYWGSSTADVYRVKLSGNWKTGTWMWSKLTTGSNTLTPADPSNGIYNRFRLARYGQDEYAVVVNSVSGPVYAFRLPANTTPRAPVLTSAQ